MSRMGNDLKKSGLPLRNWVIVCLLSVLVFLLLSLFDIPTDENYRDEKFFRYDLTKARLSNFEKYFAV